MVKHYYKDIEKEAEGQPNNQNACGGNFAARGAVSGSRGGSRSCAIPENWTEV